MPTVECSWCGEELHRAPYRLEKYTNHFCDKDCNKKWRQSDAYGGEDHPLYQREETDCDWCGATLKRKPSRLERGDHDFCDVECRLEWVSVNVSGANHPQWEGGHPREYGRHWKRVRKVVIERDNGECFLCGRSRAANRAIHGRDLSVHHVTPLSEFDQLGRGHVRGNLFAICDTCHAGLW